MLENEKKKEGERKKEEDISIRKMKDVINIFSILFFHIFFVIVGKKY